MIWGLVLLAIAAFVLMAIRAGMQELEAEHSAHAARGTRSAPPRKVGR